jgi:ribosomal protein S18 acetylase RimI-like enzyme
MTIRTMAEADLDFAAESTASEGWPIETREAFANALARDPAGCFLAELDGRPAGICVATAYERSGFIGELIVRREARARGIGPRLLECAVAYLKGRGSEAIYLDAVERAVRFYENVGFRKVCRSLRFLAGTEGRPHPEVRPMRLADLDEVFRLDRAAFGDDRSFFLERRLALYPRFAKVLLRDGSLAGFTLGFQGRGAVAVGPWVVRPEVERPVMLLESFASEAGEFPVVIGLLETNARAVEALNALPYVMRRRPSWRMILAGGDDPARLGNSPLCWAVGSAAKG